MVESEAERQSRLIGNLVRGKRWDELLEAVDGGRLDPRNAPEAIYQLAGCEDPTLLGRWLDAGTDPNWKSSPRPLAIAAGRGRMRNVELLLAAGADPAVRDTRGFTLADQARQKGHDRIADRIEQAIRARVDRQDASMRPAPGADVLIGNLTGPDHLRKAVAVLATLCGASPALWGGGDAVVLRIDSRSEAASLGLAELQARVAEHGVMVVACGEGEPADCIAVFPTTDPLEAIAASGVAGPNWDVTTTQILAFFRRHPARIERLSHDVVAGRFEQVVDLSL